MTASALALVVGAAVLHALWNGLAKRGRDQFVFLWCSMALATCLLLPFAVARLRDGGLPVAAMPFVAATSGLHAAYFYALGRAYQSGELSLVYPVARGVGVALVPVLALLVLGERLSPLGAAGVALVVLGVVTLHLAQPGPAVASPRTPWWALATGLTIAAYSVVDKGGVARLHPVPYAGLLGLGTVTLLVPAVLARRDALRLEWALNWRTILVASTMSLTAYLLVLFAFRLSKAGYVVAARELSIVLSVLLGRLWLGERATGPRLAGAAVVLAGVACVAAAR